MFPGVTYPGLTWLMRRYPDWMIGFIDAYLYNHSQLQSITRTTAYNESTAEDLLHSRYPVSVLLQILNCTVDLTTEPTERQSQIYYTTGGLPPISSSWRQAPWDSRPVILFSNWTLLIIDLMQHPLWREDGSVVYNCCWSSPAQSFSGQSPAGLMNIFYCLKFETPPTWRTRFPYLYSPGTRWPSYTPRPWVPSSSPPTTHRAMMEAFDSASTLGSPQYSGRIAD
jgi:hypothetical protein